MSPYQPDRDFDETRPTSFLQKYMPLLLVALAVLLFVRWQRLKNENRVPVADKGDVVAGGQEWEARRPPLDDTGPRPFLRPRQPVGVLRNPSASSRSEASSPSGVRIASNADDPEIDLMAQPRPIAPRGNLDDDEQATIDLFRAASAGVVFIETTTTGRDRFTLDPTDIPTGTGTGFLWDTQGHIVTNFHVIAEAEKANIRLSDRNFEPLSARLVGAAPDQDLAVLKIDLPRQVARPIPIGISEDLLVGQSVFAIGNPFGLDQTLTTGVISGLQREIKAKTGRKIGGMIQTDAAINPGNSGGPLLDSGGRLIGVNTAIYSPSGAYAGVGFAIPVDTVNRVVPQLIQHGSIIRPMLGIGAAPPDISRRLGIEGVLVLHVAPNSTAAVAGLYPTRQTRDGEIQLGDIILSLDNTEVQTINDILDYLGTRKIGDEIEITVLRGAETTRKKI